MIYGIFLNYVILGPLHCTQLADTLRRPLQNACPRNMCSGPSKKWTDPPKAESPFRVWGL